MKGSSVKSRAGSLVCRLCEEHKLDASSTLDGHTNDNPGTTPNKKLEPYNPTLLQGAKALLRPRRDECRLGKCLSRTVDMVLSSI
jgi:hypothetical protein